MPSPATSRRNPARGSAKSTLTKSKILDIGKPLGDHDTNSVREKVRQWQHQGGGVITASDIYVEEEDDEDEENAPSRVKPDKVSEPHRVTARLKTDDRQPSVESGGTRKRSHSTPRKRVVSDQHWRKERSPPRTPQAKEPQPKRITVYKINEYWNTSSSSLGGKGNAEKDDGLDPAASSRLTDDGVRVYATPSSSRKQSRATQPAKKDDHLDEDFSAENGIKPTRLTSAVSSSPPSSKEAFAKQCKGSQEEAMEGMRHTTPSPKEEEDWAVSEANFSELSKRRRRGPLESRSVRKPPKGGILGQVIEESRKMFAKPAPPPAPPTNRGDKIAAWLSATPDPFIEEQEEDDALVEIPAPLNMRSKTLRYLSRNSLGSKTAEDISDYSDATHDSDPRRKKSAIDNSRRRRSDEPGDTSRSRKLLGESPSALSEKRTKSSEPKKAGEQPSPSQLKRTGAHKCVKSSPARQDTTTTKVRDEEILPSEREFASSDGSEVCASDATFSVKLRRPFPSTGMHRLSTIASEETLSTRDEKLLLGSGRRKSSKAQKNADDGMSLVSEERDQFDPNSLPGNAPGLKRRLTKHADLMSVLSDPNSGRRSIRSARSIRSNRSRLEKATISDLMLELSADETKYMRELRTLVGGVIPVLLTCVLSRSDSAVAAGLFRPTVDPRDEINFTRPIVDMGVALERLKTLHKRIPLDDLEALLSWAQGAQRVYRDYLKAWRMGFQDVVVNLAPLDVDEAAADTQSLDQGLERDENGDVIDSTGERVDVAYLLKRPLVRLKYLAKTFNGIDFLQHSPKTEELASVYQELVEHARRRSNEERARLEDESAASIDATKTRDPETLAVLTDVSTNQTRRVLARDFFNLSLHHSSGQMVDCRAELLLRDNPPGIAPGGDLLICEIDDVDRWLLFPPIETEFVSARNGDSKGEIVVMIRGQSGQDRKWQELLSLTIDDEEIGFEWVQMLGLDPIPPAISRMQSFINRSKVRQKDHSSEKTAERSSLPNHSRVPSPSDINVPMGEASVVGRSGKSSITHDAQSSGPSILSSSSGAASRSSPVSAITRESDYTLAGSDLSPKSLPYHSRVSIPSSTESLDKASSPTSSGLKRTKAKRRSRHANELSPSGSQPRSSPTPDRELASPFTPPRRNRDYDELKRGSQSQHVVSPSHRFSGDPTPDEARERPGHQRLSSVPSMDLPTIKKIRQGSQGSHRGASHHPDSKGEDWPDSRSSPSRSKEYDASDEAEGPPAPPPHRSPSPVQLKQQNIPILSPSAARQKRRSSSPLKHEYEPSTASESSSDSDTSTVRHYDMDYSSSETSEEELDDDDMPDALPPVRTSHSHKRSPPASLPTLDSVTLSPSNSASQGPYRTVPAQPSKCSKTIASLFSWSDKGNWESLLPDDCSVVVTPGLIEAFKMNAAHSESPGPRANSDDNDDNRRERPLIAMELTPLVPIRRGTAIDISIRSPPTERSKMKNSNNVMFRSRNVEECETLYALINHARINNPTYIALQNARGPYGGQPTSLGRYNSIHLDKGTTSWFGFPRRKNSYRASKRASSVGMQSESSVGTMSSAFSALKRFGTGSKMFSIARSSLTSSRGESSLYSSSLGSGGASGLGAIAEAIKGADGIGLSNAKIRLYVRESMSKWRDMGAARLTIMPVTPKSSRPGTAGSIPDTTDANASPPADEYSEQIDGDESVAEGASTPTPAASPRHVTTVPQEKRIIIHGKTRGEVLLDACLGETSFERVARTGIAVSVWEQNGNGTIRHKGGVIGGSFRVYMIQMKSEAEAAYTFGLVGKLRY